jgi:hypothetical protein
MFPIDLLVAVVIGYAAAVLFFAARTLGTSPRSIAFVVLGTLVLGGAPMTAHGLAMIRCALGMAMVIFIMHMWDLHLDPERASRLGLKDYAVWLGDYGWSVARIADGYGVELSWKRRGLDAAYYLAGLYLVSVLVAGTFRVDWHRYSFWLEHAAKSICLGTWCVWAYNLNTAVWRLLGGPAALFTEKNVLGASSLAEFWRRWNRPMCRWLLENVYKPLGGRRSPYLAGLATFALSGLLHEYLYAVTFRCVTGYFLAFFLLQGIATLLTRRVKPTGPLVVPAVLLTFTFNTFSTVLLFLPIDEQVPFYVNDVPKWVYPW